MLYYGNVTLLMTRSFQNQNDATPLFVRILHKSKITKPFGVEYQRPVLHCNRTGSTTSNVKDGAFQTWRVMVGVIIMVMVVSSHEMLRIIRHASKFSFAMMQIKHSSGTGRIQQGFLHMDAIPPILFQLLDTGIGRMGSHRNANDMDSSNSSWQTSGHVSPDSFPSKGSLDRSFRVGFPIHEEIVGRCGRQ